MPRTCSVCTHWDQASIDAALVAGRTIRDIAGQFGLRRSAIARHSVHRVHRARTVISKHSGMPADLCKAVLASLQALRDRLPQHPPGVISEPLRQAVQAVEALRRALETR
jgi:hypothetical protein